MYFGFAPKPLHTLQGLKIGEGLVSLRISGGAPGALAAIARLTLWKRATSLGGVESLIEHRATSAKSAPPDLLRLSVGLESTDDLIAELEDAI